MLYGTALRVASSDNLQCWRDQRQLHAMGFKRKNAPDFSEAFP